jgi:stage V sporulation protein SpoVS
VALRAFLRDGAGVPEALREDEDVQATIGALIVSDGLHALRIVRSFLTDGKG